jgi:hypothetical protein
LPGTKYILPPDVSDSEVRTQLDRVRSSAPFRSSRRCVIFLDFVVHAALEGRIESLKERTIGVEVFHRDPNYDTNQDPVVRGTASEVRKRLAQYYQIPGHERELKVDLPPGSYAPDFHMPAGPTAIIAASPAIAPVATPASVRAPRLWWLAVPAAVIVAVLAIAHFWPKQRTVVDEFWTPMLRSPEPVLLCVGQPKVYNLVGNLELDIAKKIPSHSRLPPDAANEKITTTLGSIVPNWDRYLALGDALCLADMAALFSQRGHEYHIRGGGSTSFADLRENPAVLIGGFTNDWTLRLTGQLRFTFEQSADRRMVYVHDARHPANHDWQLTDVWPAWTMPLDYAIVSRVLDPATGRVVVSAAGITQYGTEAAGEFLTNPDYLAQAIHQAPADWQHKSLEVVLSTKVIGGTAGPPHVLATQFW